MSPRRRAARVLNYTVIGDRVQRSIAHGSVAHLRPVQDAYLALCRRAVSEFADDAADHDLLESEIRAFEEMHHDLVKCYV